MWHGDRLSPWLHGQSRRLPRRQKPRSKGRACSQDIAISVLGFGSSIIAIITLGCSCPFPLRFALRFALWSKPLASTCTHISTFWSAFFRSFSCTICVKFSEEIWPWRNPLSPCSGRHWSWWRASNRRTGRCSPSPFSTSVAMCFLWSVGFFFSHGFGSSRCPQFERMFRFLILGFNSCSLNFTFGSSDLLQRISWRKIWHQDGFCR